MLADQKIVAAFRGMQLSKHRYASVTERQTDGRTTDKVIPLCRYASQATQKYMSAYGKATTTGIKLVFLNLEHQGSYVEFCFLSCKVVYRAQF